MAGARKVAIITGAARGIGAGVAQGLAKAGYTVSLVGLEGDLLRQKARQLGQATDSTAGEDLAAAIRQELGRPLNSSERPEASSN